MNSDKAYSDHNINHLSKTSSEDYFLQSIYIFIKLIYQITTQVLIICWIYKFNRNMNHNGILWGWVVVIGDWIIVQRKGNTEKSFKKMLN